MYIRNYLWMKSHCFYLHQIRIRQMKWSLWKEGARVEGVFCLKQKSVWNQYDLNHFTILSKIIPFSIFQLNNNVYLQKESFSHSTEVSLLIYNKWCRLYCMSLRWYTWAQNHVWITVVLHIILPQAIISDQSTYL